MKKPIVFMFSGQGSHYYQMSQYLFNEDPIFNHWIQSADLLYQKKTDFSIIQELYQNQNKKSKPFNRTLFTHPAIFIVEYATAQLLISQGITPDYVLGASLGEFTAAVIAGILSFEDALDAVITQAQMIEEKCIKGSMLAILKSSDFYYDNKLLYENSELAATNFHSHFIISGKINNILKIEIFLKEQQILYQPLAVTHGFHSSFIDTVKLNYLDSISQYKLQTPKVSFVSCTHSAQLTSLPLQYFWDIIRRPIHFQATIEMLEKQNRYIYLDLGPSGTLATFIKYNLGTTSASQTFPTLTPFGQNSKNVEKIRDFLAI